jgi:methionyl aminopeptidase
MARDEYTLKTNDQIIRMCEAGEITAMALKAIRDNIKAGMTSLDIDAIAEAEIVRLGGHSNFKLVPGYSHTICVSVNEEVVHGIPSKERFFAPGDIISIDCGAETADGWNGDSAMTIVLPGGDANKAEIRNKLSAVTEGSLWAGIAALAKAKHLHEVGAAVQKHVLSHGNYGILEDYVGHGIGRSMHEDPPVYNFAVKQSGPKVVPGLCVAIEPMVTAGSKATKVLGDGWTVATKDGLDASHWEHSVAVHETGIWVMTAFDGGKADLAPFGVVPVDPRNI